MSAQFDDVPIEGTLVETLDNPLCLPAIVFGAATLSTFYNSDDYVASDVPVRTIRLALRYGIRAFDTSFYYGDSEVVLGKALQAVKNEFPRSSYQLMTKCGRCGVNDFDYSPERIRDIVQQSLIRLQTGYLDTVYLHDVEFVATRVPSQPDGSPLSALTDAKELYGLANGDEGNIRGEGDRKILNAYAELRKLRDEGMVKHIGITGYPLPVLLRLALLILHNPPYEPVEVLLSYSHLTLQNGAFKSYATELQRRAQVGQLLAASPFSMGLLTPSVPEWHPAPPRLKAAARDAATIWPDGLPNLALGYALRHSGTTQGNVPLVVGFSTPEQIHECIKVWRETQRESNPDRLGAEESAREVFRQAGYLDWSWASP